MSVTVSIVSPDDVAQMVSTLSEPYTSQSDFIETAIRRFITHLRREEQHRQDMEIINRHADGLNEETQDALKYQIML